MDVYVEKIDEIHLGERLKYLINKAPHGQGLSGFARFLDRSTGSVHHMYKVEDLDFKVVVKACTYYGVSMSEFLGVSVSDDSLSIVNEAPEAYGGDRMDRMERKLDEILKLIKK